MARFQTGATYNGGLGAVADFNQDGIPDLAASGSSGARYPAGQWRWDVSGGTGHPGVVTVAHRGGRFHNGDGKPDIAGGLLEFGTVGVVFGNGDATFQIGPVTDTELRNPI